MPTEQTYRCSEGSKHTDGFLVGMIDGHIGVVAADGDECVCRWEEDIEHGLVRQALSNHRLNVCRSRIRSPFFPSLLKAISS